MSIGEFMAWLINSGGAIVVCSWILERIPSYKLQTPELKQWIFFLASALISVVAYCVVAYVPAETLSAVAPFFSVLYMTFVNVFLGSSFHKIDKIETKG